MYPPRLFLLAIGWSSRRPGTIPCYCSSTTAKSRPLRVQQREPARSSARLPLFISARHLVLQDHHPAPCWRPPSSCAQDLAIDGVLTASPSRRTTLQDLDPSWALLYVVRARLGLDIGLFSDQLSRQSSCPTRCQTCLDPSLAKPLRRCSMLLVWIVAMRLGLIALIVSTTSLVQQRCRFLCSRW
jgi:hypothetical protein